MSLPVNSPLADPRSICHAIHGTDDGDAPSVSDPVQLFADDYDANNGNIMTLSPSRIYGPHSKSAAIKRPALGSPSRSPYNASRTTKRIQTSPRRVAKAAASAVINVVTQLTQPSAANNPTQPLVPIYVEPPRINRADPSPTSVLNALFTPAEPAPKRKPKQTNNRKVGLVPKSTFIKWARVHHFSNKEKYTDSNIKKGLQQCRTRMTWQFNQVSNATNRHNLPRIEETNTPVGRVTRSSNVEDFDDWIVDTAAAELTTNDRRRLSIYPLEQLLLCKERTKLLILVKEVLWIVSW